MTTVSRAERVQVERRAPSGVMPCPGCGGDLDPAGSGGKASADCVGCGYRYVVDTGQVLEIRSVASFLRSRDIELRLARPSGAEVSYRFALPERDLAGGLPLRVHLRRGRTVTVVATRGRGGVEDVVGIWGDAPRRRLCTPSAPGSRARGRAVGEAVILGVLSSSFLVVALQTWPLGIALGMVIGVVGGSLSLVINHPRKGRRPGR